MTRMATVLLLLALAGCAAQKPECLVAGEQPMTVTELFFGRDILGRQPLTEQAWSDFSARVIAKEFPDGFTTMDGEGEWLDPVTHAMNRERTKILIVAAAAKSSDLASRVSRVRDAYARLYSQTSVGLLTYDACGGF